MHKQKNLVNLKLAQLFLGNNPYQEPILNRIIDREISEDLDIDTREIIKNIGLEDFQKKASIYHELNMVLSELHLLNMKLSTLSEDDYKAIPIKDEIHKRVDFIQEQLEVLNIVGISRPDEINDLLDEFQSEDLKESRRPKESSMDLENLILFSSEKKNEFLKSITNVSSASVEEAIKNLLKDSQLIVFSEISSKLDLDDQLSMEKLTKELESGKISEQEFHETINDEEISLFRMFRKIFSKTVGTSIKLTKGTA